MCFKSYSQFIHLFILISSNPFFSFREGMLEFFGSDEKLNKAGILRRSENAPQVCTC